jgi:hypothetical protein
MATLQQSIVTFMFVAADPAASPGAYLPLVPVSMPDGVDASCLHMPFAGTLVGCDVVGAPASGDTVIVQPTIGNSKTFGSNTGVNSLTTTITNANPGVATIVSKDQADAQFAAGQWVGVTYQTTTGGSYTPHDLMVTLYISTGRTDI